MTTVLYRSQGEQFFDSDGKVLANGLLYYYRAGTSTPQATYSDQAGVVPNANPVPLNAAGRIATPIYLGSAYDYKETLTDANSVAVPSWPFDNIPKAVTVSNAQTGFERLYMPWVSVTSASSPVTIATADAGTAYAADASSGNITLNLPAATAMQAGTGYCFKRLDATANTVTVAPHTTDLIDGVNASIVVPSGYNGVMLITDGAQWLAVALYSPISRLVGVAQSVSAGTSLVVDLNLGWYIKLTVTATISSFTIQHCPASGTLVKVTLDITNNGAYNLTGWPGTIKWAAGQGPTLTSGAGKRDVLMLTTTDGGTNWLGYIVSQNLS